MARLNVKAPGADYRKDSEVRLAGGMGTAAAMQGAEALLRRSVLATLLWEQNAYTDGKTVAQQIGTLIPQIDPNIVARIAVEARVEQQLRHVPLLIAREMLRHPTHRGLVGTLLPQIIRRPDELSEFVAIYWQDGRKMLPKQAKIGLARAFTSFNAYQLAKWNRDRAVKLRDVLFLCHARPESPEQASLWKALVEGNLPAPDTWEVALSAGSDKRTTWERLIRERKLGVQAFLKNLRNMEQAGVPASVIREGFATVNPSWLLPFNVITAARHAPNYERELEALLLRSLGELPKLPGHTVLVADVSGSMGSGLSSKSELNRLDATTALVMLASEVCQSVSIYATAGDDHARVHQTERLKPRRGFALADEVRNARARLGGGGIFTRQALEHIRKAETGTPDRILVFSDSQDCDHSHQRVPAPFGRRNYIVDVSSEARGINYQGIWTAEITGFSGGLLRYIAALEGVSTGATSESDDDSDSLQ